MCTHTILGRFASVSKKYPIYNTTGQTFKYFNISYWGFRCPMVFPKNGGSVMAANLFFLNN